MPGELSGVVRDVLLPPLLEDTDGAVVAVLRRDQYSRCMD